MTTRNDIEAIKAAESIKQYCEERGCTSCIFNFHGDCILYDRDSDYDYMPCISWDLDLIKGE